ncbi:MarR family winged helix-turn-helix transcriptional regulator [Streptomyces lavendulae]|uniref:Transcriptional regulator HosA n=1 Tax=Streptomyces lavendulae subsp. lavendulae TaxID=58340 RepID=A0A2K8PD80_STRLA|nr:MarR family transcriptional regulator [Streptomyces lavendulae]ATZ24692.1 Transcriptional regulator HosA [Streptomyces lavendulae subsp. lavendulae]QUQ54522.1 putative HTH-type transcriptional regulator [Streptomyces lavendulae subsp. lavendulae]GLV80728.1 MarR family transcriptional regulator [Streptomyces lavendulae subsp. lavendulae]GLX35299.1 MarR family transcriptional regulator [Streptomyces roseochromogenus]
MTSMPPEERIGSHIKRAEQALLAAKNTACKPAAVTVPQYAALLWLAEKPGISAAALSRLCGVTPPTMNTVLKNLQERGLIDRTPHEWHRNVLETRLTEEGRAVMERADAGAVRVERALAAALSAEDRERLVELLGRCAEVLDTLK